MLNRRRRLLVLVLVLVVVLVGVVGASVARWLDRPPVPVVVDSACPALLPGTSDALDDYADLVTWAGDRFVGAEAYVDTPEAADVSVGAAVGRVTCSLGSMPNEQGWSLAPGPWPDGTATVLEVGATLFEVVDREPGRALVARTTAGDRLYCLADEETLEARC